MEPREVDGYTIDMASEADIPGFLSLHERVFDMWPAAVAREAVEWKYVENPVLEGIPVIVARDDGTVVGAKGHFGLELAVGDRTLPGIQTCDLMVHPDHRRQGIHAAMIEYDTVRYDEGEQLFFGFPVTIPTKGYLRRGRTRLRKPLYTRSLPDEDTSLRSRLRAVLERVGAAEEPVERHEEPPIDALLALYRRSVPPGVHVDRTRTFYEWRLGDPTERFTTYLVRSDGDPAAAAIVGSRGRMVVVRELLPYDADPAAVGTILEAVVADHAGDRLLVAWLPPAMDDGLFEDTGLSPGSHLQEVAYGPNVVARSVGGDWTVSGVPLDELEGWDIQLLVRDF